MEKSIQAGDVMYRTTVSIDPITAEMLSQYLEYSRDVLGIKVSTSVLVRAGIRRLYLTSLKRIVDDQTKRKHWPKAQRVKVFLEANKRNKKELLKAAGKEER